VISSVSSLRVATANCTSVPSSASRMFRITTSFVGSLIATVGEPPSSWKGSAR
jgi:hypothetical protein